MTSQNLAICIAPSLLWTTKTLKATSPIETVSACEIVEFIIDNFQDIFGEEATTVLGSESEIQPPMSYDDEDSSDANNEIPDLESPETKCDVIENIKPKSFNLLVPENNIISFSNHTTPEFDKRTISTKQENGTKPIENLVYGLNKQNRRHSENDLTDMNDNVESRKPRKRFPLESFTTTAELIKHDMNGHANQKNEELSPTVIRIVRYNENPTSPTNTNRKLSPSNRTLYHQKTRPAPTYEEALKTLRNNDRRTRSPQFSSRNSDERSNSSDESIPSNSADVYTTSGVFMKSSSTPSTPLRETPTMSLRETFINQSKGEINNINAKIERQNYILRTSTHQTFVEPFQTKKYTAEELRRRSPDEVFSNSARWRQRVAPSYEEHVQRRKRFEKAYLGQINLDKKDDQRFDANRNLLGESLNDRTGFTRSLNHTESKIPSGNDPLSKSLDSSKFRSLRNRSNSDGRSGIPLSNGIHTFLTQRKSQDENNDAKRSPKEQRSHQTVTFTHSVHPIYRTTESSQEGDSTANKAISPLRAAINAGSFMYCSDDVKKDARIGLEKSTRVSSKNENNTEHLSENQKQDFTKAAEDFDKILSNLRNYDAVSDSSSSHSSISDQACDLDIPSQEDIKNILCQDESYV